MGAAGILRGVIVALVLAVGLLYTGDYLWARHRMSASTTGGALGSVNVRRYWEVPRKDGRVEFSWDPPQAETCVHSLFPHFGYTPCWYAVRHTTIRGARAVSCPPLVATSELSPATPSSLNGRAR